MRFVLAHERDNFFHVLPDQIFQNDGSDVMTTALVLVGSVRGADKKILPLFKIVSGGIVKLLSAIGTEHQTRKRTALARSRSPMSLLSDFLYLVKDFLFDNRRMGVVENLLIFFGISSARVDTHRAFCKFQPCCLLQKLVGQHPKPFNDFFKIGYAPVELKITLSWKVM
jgi:hypothetical protein